MSSQEKDKKACYNCIMRHIACDKTGVRCNRCAKGNLECPSYGIRYRFANEETKPQPASFPGVKHIRSRRRKRSYKWIKYWTELATPEPQMSPASSTVSHSPSPSSNSLPSPSSLPGIISDIDPRTRLCFLHFAENVAPFLVMFDGKTNGYRHHILPMAYSEPLVEKAVCVVSASHISAKQRRLCNPAEIIRGGLIRRLFETSRSEPDLSETTWATLVLLVASDIISGRDDVLVIYELLTTFIKARGPLEEPMSPLQRFLHFQSSILGFFIQPFSHLESHYNNHSPIPILEDYYRYDPCLHRINSHYECTDYETWFPIYEELFRLAGEICVAREGSAVLPTTLVDHIRDCVTQIKLASENIEENTPGFHAIVWPVFVAAAESFSDSNRRYFTTVLKQLWERTSHVNILRGLEVLPDIWAQRGKRSWISMILDYKGLVIC
ncbi:uncharacterized protein F4822DRAFT_256191 [Hypoxylon trugodes]|uniref:uncharacterized protein n=1 Tax=Hypoxylon trugodes TaxID=326681 RepID=UPI0021A24D5C|nr:uncharacterized protein F4822DRAFT_256191 [Hypoxylon trugodes]KAI1388754.1 hypothetical protein F4822DRAFT_256191 [Hypoxylon trugodes]